MHPAFTVSQTSIRLRGKAIAGAEDRQQKIPGFDQEVFSKSSVLCIGAGGIISQIAPTLVRKGIGQITLLDDDVVEASNLNRQRFYITGSRQEQGPGAWPRTCSRECIAATEIRGLAVSPRGGRRPRNRPVLRRRRLRRGQQSGARVLPAGTSASQASR